MYGFIIHTIIEYLFGVKIFPEAPHTILANVKPYMSINTRQYVQIVEYDTYSGTKIQIKWAVKDLEAFSMLTNNHSDV